MKTNVYVTKTATPKHTKHTKRRKLSKKEHALIMDASKLAYYTTLGFAEAADGLDALMEYYPHHTKAGIMIAAYFGAIDIRDARILCGMEG